MDFCIVGAPGAGKSDLAALLALALSTPDQSYGLVDDYAEAVGNEANLAIGPWGGYIANFIIAGERLKREMAHIKSEEPYIVVGSLVETITYFSLNGTSTPRTRDDIPRIATFMQMMGVLLGDMHSYARTFFLPLPEGHENHWISREIETALDTLGVPYATLSEDDRLDQALAHVEQARLELEAAEAQQRGVREGGEDGSEDGSPPNDVPNLSGHGSDGLGQ